MLRLSIQSFIYILKNGLRVQAKSAEAKSAEVVEGSGEEDLDFVARSDIVEGSGASPVEEKQDKPKKVNIEARQDSLDNMIELKVPMLEEIETRYTDEQSWYKAAKICNFFQKCRWIEQFWPKTP